MLLSNRALQELITVYHFLQLIVCLRAEARLNSKITYNGIRTAQGAEFDGAKAMI